MIVGTVIVRKTASPDRMYADTEFRPAQVHTPECGGDKIIVVDTEQSPPRVVMAYHHVNYFFWGPIMPEEYIDHEENLRLRDGTVVFGAKMGEKFGPERPTTDVDSGLIRLKRDIEAALIFS